MGGWMARWLIKKFLRFMRARLDGIDVAGTRRWANRVDWLLGRFPSDVTTSREEHGAWSGTWIDVPPTRRERVILYLHGGAFIMETPRIHTRLLAKLCRGAHARGFMVSYRLAPEHPFPAAVDDCLAAYRHLLDAGYAPSDILVAGDSAGGNLALVTLLGARKACLPLPCGAVALSPFTDGTFSGESMRRNAGHDPLFDEDVFRPVATLYVSGEVDAMHPFLSPLFADLDGLPPLMLIAGSSELLLDDSVRLAARARDVTLEVWHDMPHVFPAFPLLREAPIAIENICRFVRERFAAAGALAEATVVNLLAEAPVA